MFSAEKLGLSWHFLHTATLMDGYGSHLLYRGRIRDTRSWGHTHNRAAIIVRAAFIFFLNLTVCRRQKQQNFNSTCVFNIWAWSIGSLFVMRMYRNIYTCVYIYTKNIPLSKSCNRCKAQPGHVEKTWWSCQWESQLRLWRTVSILIS